MTRSAASARTAIARPRFPVATEPYSTTAGAWMLAECHTNAQVDTEFGASNGVNFTNFPNMKGISVRVGACDLYPTGTTTFNSGIWDYAKATYIKGLGFFQTRFMFGKWTPKFVYTTYGARSYVTSTALSATCSGTSGTKTLTLTTSPNFINNQCLQVQDGANSEYVTVSSGGGTTTLTLVDNLGFNHTSVTVTQIAPVPFDTSGVADAALRLAYQQHILADVVNWHITNGVKWMHLSHYGRDFAEINAEQALANLTGYNKAAFETAFENLISDAYAYTGFTGTYPTKIYIEIPLTGFGNATDGIGTIDNDLMAWCKNTLTAGTGLSSIGGDPVHIAIGINAISDTSTNLVWGNFHVGHHMQMVGVADYDWLGNSGTAGVLAQFISQQAHSIEIYRPSWQTGNTHVDNGNLADFVTRVSKVAQARTAAASRNPS